MLEAVGLEIRSDWAGGIEQLVQEANRRLVHLLPEDRSGRPKDEVNARLVRHYTTQGLLSAPRREGREARYMRTHLLELLALRRLMADGLGGKVLMSALEGRTEKELATLAMRGSDGLAAAGSGSAAPVDAALENRAVVQKRRHFSAQPQSEEGRQALSFLNDIRREANLPPPLLSPAPAPPADEAPMVFFQSAPSPAPQFLVGMGIAASSSPPVPHRRRPKTVTQLEVRHGLELQVSSRLAWPQTAGQWDALMREIRTSLLLLQKTSPRTSTDDAGEDQAGDGAKET
ncbi:MerR family transcriptional regulator [Deinococcus oregonensis]|uniref:MerR family transcriptional regulator n=1 Tax=Deinococcus oregonensis TaxID=1805970 RepID=A0ABV6B2T0_9DEIO